MGQIGLPNIDTQNRGAEVMVISKAKAKPNPHVKAEKTNEQTHSLNAHSEELSFTLCLGSPGAKSCLS